MSSRGAIRVPGDKSISHRALILASLATGRSRIRGILESADVHSTAVVLRSLGAALPTLSGDFETTGRGLRGLTRSHSPLQCGNSGTTARLIAGLVAAYPYSSRFEGDASLSRRPMRRIAEPLTAMGARFEFDRGDGLPMTVHGGRLAGISWDTRAASAQTKSAILMAALVGGTHASVREAGKSRDHTERLLRFLGVPLETTGDVVQLSPVASFDGFDLEIPGDPSSAAYLAALGTLLPRTRVAMNRVCINRTRIGFLSALQSMGGSVEYKNVGNHAGEEIATVNVATSRLRAHAFTARDVPAMIDELPLLGCVAAAAGIELNVTGAGELRVKESDRITALALNLRAIGAEASELPDGFRIVGSRRPLAGKVTTYSDHRIAMAFGILAALPGNRIEIDDRECVSISYPGFWTDVEAITQR
ncbi:MAG TPA: 3-phosphoshikimate 1-carboxyvinyltransferase [Gemmatimonadaceae bacterium]|nr:3-phosphoshikimate 1-carboxyvinyltransferase [Gemmatimonadaceae bacterium]